jgi:hypothetical protein
MVGDGANEGRHGVDGKEEEDADAEEPEAKAKGVAAAVCEEQDDRPKEVELLFYRQRPEMVERQGRGGAERVAGEVREVLEENDEDQERAELGKVRTVEYGGDGYSEQGEEVEGQDPEGAAGVEVTQANEVVGGFPKASGDEEAGEGEEEDDAGPAELGEVAGEALGGLGGLEASAVVEDEDEEDGEAAEAVECDIAPSFGDGRVGVRRKSGGRCGRIEG